jgi:hypothetical protein
MRKPIVVVGVCVLLVLTARAATADPVQWAGNGHWYEVVESTSLTWEEARLAAEGMTWMATPGHLATVTSQEERDFLAPKLPSYYWLGGYQDPPSSLPAEGWRWVTGEPWSYTDWKPGEPNDYAGSGGVEACLDWRATGWNDALCTGSEYFVVEYDTDSAVAKTTWGTVKALYRPSGS